MKKKYQSYTAQKMKLKLRISLVNKHEQICRKLGIWSHLLKKSLMENFIFCAVLHYQKCFFNIELSSKDREDLL